MKNTEKKIDKKTGLLKVIIPPFLYKLSTKLYGKKYTQETYLINKKIK